MLWPLRLETPKPMPLLRFEAIELRQDAAPVSAAGPTASASNVRMRFSTTVVALTDLRVTNLAGAIDEIHGRPVPVSVRVPSDEVVVQSDGILEPVLPHGALDVLNGPLECELGTVDADDREVGLVLIVHRRRNGRVGWQFTHAKVQNSSRTTRSRRAASLSGSPSGVLNHGSTPTSSGARRQPTDA